MPWVDSLVNERSFPSPLKEEAIHIASAATLPGFLFAAFRNSNVPRYSRDGGLTWHLVKSHPWPDGSVLAVAVAPRPDGQPRLIVGAFQILMYQSTVTFYRSGNLGESWAEISGIDVDPQCGDIPSVAEDAIKPSPVDPSRLYLFFPCVVFSGGEYDFIYTLYTSPDAGVSWTRSISGMWSPVILVSPVLPKRVYFYQSPAWVVSDDAGLTWKPVNLPGSMYAEAFVLDGQDPNIVYNSLGYRSLDGGLNWTTWAEQPCPLSTAGLDADFAIPRLLYYACPGGLQRSRDGGDHWESITNWVGQGLHPDLGNRTSLLWRRDDGLWVSTDQGSTWKHLTDNYLEKPFFPWNNLDTPDEFPVYAVVPLAEEDLWAFGDSGLIAHWRGGSWQRVSSSVSTALFAAQFITPNDGWAVGDQAILRWDGQAWTVAAQVSAKLKALDVISASDAWAVGEAGKIFHWNGVEWSETTSPTEINLESIDMLSAEEGWAVGGQVQSDIMGEFPGVILRWQNGQWVIFKEANVRFSDVVMLSPTDGWVVCFYDWTSPGNRVFHWNGTDWLEVLIPDNPLRNGLRSLTFQSSEDGWAVGDGIVMHWNGAQWTNLDIGTIPYIVALFALPSGKACFLLDSAPSDYDPGDGPSMILCDRGESRIYLPAIHR